VTTFFTITTYIFGASGWNLVI